jgi:hypothetical protein
VQQNRQEDGNRERDQNGRRLRRQRLGQPAILIVPSHVAAVCRPAVPFFSIQVLGRALAVAQLFPYNCAGDGDARSSGGEFRVFEGPGAGIFGRGTRCWRSGDDVTKGFAGLAPSVAALGLDRSVAERNGNSAVPLGAQSRSQARRRFHASPPLTRHR